MRPIKSFINPIINPAIKPTIKALPQLLIVTGNPFKAVIRTLLVFLLLLGVSVYILINSITSALQDELESQIVEESRKLNHIYQNEGIHGLRQALSQVQSSEQLSDVYSGDQSLTSNIRISPDYIDDADRAIDDIDSAENVSAAPVHILQRQTGRLVLYQVDTRQYVAQLTQLDEFVLVVGRNTRIIETVRNRLLFGALLMGLAFIGLALVIGYSFSRRSSQKLTQFETTLTKVADGNLSARLPIDNNLSQTDQIDQIALSMNTQLARLETLVDNMNRSIKAVAHDLKTPLSRAQISLYNALDSIDNGESPEPYIQQALDENMNLNRIFDTILRISRLQTQGQDKVFNEFKVKEIVDDVVDFLSPNIEDNKQRLVIKCDPDLTAIADKDMLQQAMLNLVDNAILYAGMGATIVIKARVSKGRQPESTNNSASLVLQVCDDGVGVPEGELDNITTAFVRLDSARSSTGNGLGLALVQAIADYHGATLQFSHNQPSGLCVTLSLP